MVRFLVFIALQVCVSAARSRMADCLKHEYYSRDSRKCLSCTLCSKSEEYRAHPVCKEKNTKPVPHHGGQFLWCDDGHKDNLPECPPLDKSILMGRCSNSCQQNDRQFAPGCVCTVGCNVEESYAVYCTHDLKWNETIPAAEKCAELDSPGGPSREDKDFSLSGIIIGTALGLVFIVVVVLIYVVWRRNCRQESFTPASSSGGGSDSPFIGDEKSELDEAVHFLRDVNENEREKVKLEQVPDGQKTEETKQTEADITLPTGAAPTHMGGMPKVDPTWKALGELLDSRDDLDEFTMMFDQRYEYGKISWHDVANKLLHWDADKVNHVEHLRSNLRRDGSPSDGCMSKVLKEAHEKGHGLRDLLTCLQSLEFTHHKAEQFLVAFLSKFNKQVKNDPYC